MASNSVSVEARPHGLLIIGGGLERRAFRRAVLDALRNVRVPEAGYMPFIVELAQSTSSTLEALGAEAQKVVGPLNVQIAKLKAVVTDDEIALQLAIELHKRLAQAAPPRPSKTEAASRPASHSDAQARRRARAAQASAAQSRATAAGHAAELAAVVAQRATAVAPLRQQALQLQALGDAAQAAYFGWLLRFSRLRSGIAPNQEHLFVELPLWVIDDDVLYDIAPKSGASTYTIGKTLESKEGASDGR